MKSKTTFALTLLIGMSAIGGSAKEAPNTGPAEPIITGSNRGTISVGTSLRTPVGDDDRGQIVAYTAPGVGDPDKPRRPFLKRLSAFFKGNTVVPEKRAASRKGSAKREAKDEIRHVLPERVGYVFAPSLDELRLETFDNRATKKQRRIRKAEERRDRLAGAQKKRTRIERAVARSDDPEIAARLARAHTGPDRGAGSWFHKTFAGMRIQKPVTSDRKYGHLVARYARAYGVPVELAHAVIKVESNYRPNVRGRAGEVGLMQIKPATARMMGYSGSTKGLYSPETNIKYGMKYLAKAHKLGGGTTCGTILKYNAGHAARRMNPISARYCAKVKRHLRGV